MGLMDLCLPFHNKKSNEQKNNKKNQEHIISYELNKIAETKGLSIRERGYQNSNEKNDRHCPFRFNQSWPSIISPLKVSLPPNIEHADSCLIC